MLWKDHTGTNRKAFRALARLRELREVERAQLYSMSTPEDRDLVYEVGWRQAGGRPLTVKEALLLDVGSVATVQRRLRKLCHSGVIAQRRNAEDRRVQELMLTPKTLGVFARCDDLLSEGAEREAA